MNPAKVVRVLTRGRESGDLKAYLRNNPLIDNELIADEGIRFKIPGNPTTAIGSEATRLIEICEKYLQASEQGKLKASQLKLALQAGIIIRACAKVEFSRNSKFKLTHYQKADHCK